ncbi:MAG: hypothetical protein EBV23_08295 [Flavobacteriia bacterium]|nr:hypothetical protein [Flavobacteriia bacterium]
MRPIIHIVGPVGEVHPQAYPIISRGPIDVGKGSRQYGSLTNDHVDQTKIGGGNRLTFRINYVTRSRILFYLNSNCHHGIGHQGARRGANHRLIVNALWRLGKSFYPEKEGDKGQKQRINE